MKKINNLNEFLSTLLFNDDGYIIIGFAFDNKINIEQRPLSHFKDYYTQGSLKEYFEKDENLFFAYSEEKLFTGTYKILEAK